MATPWLHVLNEHPSNLAQYERRKSLLGAIGKFLAWLGLRLMRVATRRWKWLSTHPLPPRCDVLVFSHILSRAQAASPKDFYFGSLPAALEYDGKSAAVVMLNHSSVSVRELCALSPAGGPLRIFLAGHAGLLGELRIAFAQVRESIRLAVHGSTRGSKSIARRAAAEVLGGSTADNLALHEAVKRLVMKVRPAAVLVTYEGHAWERLVFDAARAIDPDVRCVGYHHAVLFPRQHAVSRSLSSRYDPNLVLFAGEVARQRFARRSSIDAPLEIVGTGRNDPPISQLETKLKACSATSSCLVLPDAFLSECGLLIRFALKCASLLPDVRFVIRLHPLTSPSDLLEADGSLRSLPRNVTFSDRSIDADFADCRWALYRGSGAGVRAAAVGLRPFYLRVADETMSMDPLFEMQPWRKIICSPDEFAGAVQDDLGARPGSLEAEFSSAREYLESYFVPMDAGKFARLVAG